MADVKPVVAMAHFGSSGLMGQHEYERQLIGRLERSELVSGRSVPIRSLRSRDAGRRIPLRFVTARSLPTQRMLSRAIYGPADLVHRMDARLPASADEVLTLHDVAPLIFEDEGTWPATATASARRARVVLAPSEFAAREIRAKLGAQRTLAIPNGVDPACYVAGPLTVEDRATIGASLERFVVCVGGSTRRKNLPALADAWARLNTMRDDAELVICGDESSEKTRLFAHLPRCRLVGNVDRALLLRLITSATAVVIPSLYEGFGLPVVEAMAAGTVAVSARTSSLVEVAGEPGILADPTAEGLAAGLNEALTGTHELRIEAGRRWARTFDWDATAQRHAELYLSLLAR